MSLYSNGQPSPTSAVPRRVTGRYIAKAHLTRRQRIRLAADLSNGVAELYPLTVTQAAFVMKVSMFDVSRARRNGHNGNGTAPLVTALRAGTDAERGKVVHTLGTEVIRKLGVSLLSMSPAHRVALARQVGIDWLWDHMIAPLVSEERAAAGDNSQPAA
jgi:hypothetical protein